MPDNIIPSSTDVVAQSTIVPPRTALQQHTNHQPIQHPTTNIQRIHLGTINNNNNNDNNNNDLIQNIDEIVETTDATVVSTLSNSVPAVYFHFDNEANRINIMNIIKNKVFHTYKYIRSKSDLDFQTNEHSLCQMILNRLNVSDDLLICQTCWNQIRYMVPKYLNSSCTIKISAIRKKFNGTLQHYALYLRYCSTLTYL